MRLTGEERRTFDRIEATGDVQGLTWRADQVAHAAEVRGARAVLAAVEALHRRWPDCEPDDDSVCEACLQRYDYPCPTLTAARAAVTKIEAGEQ